MRISRDIKGKYKIEEINVNDSFELKVIIYDENDTAKNLTGTTTTFKISEYIEGFDTGGTVDYSVNAVNNADQTTYTGYATITVPKASVQALGRGVWWFEMRTVFTPESYDKSIIGKLVIE